MSAGARRPLGRIITFYSYKGGTGRSLAVANVAWILAAAGRQVLVVDWDLEAPGLHRYFRPFVIDEELTATDGLIDLLDRYATRALEPGGGAKDGAGPGADWYLPLADVSDAVVTLDFGGFPAGGRIDLLPAGRQGPLYGLKVSSFDWQTFYERLGGGGFLEALKRSMREGYDYVLIDSRTGLSDTSGICTVQMPDTVVACFTMNNQSIRGAAAVARSAEAQKLAMLTAEWTGADPASRGDGARPFRVFPVPTRVDPGETERLRLRQEYAREMFAGLVRHVDASELASYWRAVEVPYRVQLAYEEILAPFVEDPLDPKSALAAFVRLARHITDGDVSAYTMALAPDTRQQLVAAFARTQGATAPQPQAQPAETEDERQVREADAALGGLEEPDRQAARAVLLRLVKVSRPEEGSDVFPARVRRDALDTAQQAVAARLGTIVIERPQGPLGVAGGPELPVVPVLEWRDPRLPAIWKTLRAWVDEDREFLVWRQQTRGYLADWARQDQDRGALLGGALLGEAEGWARSRAADLNGEERAYIEASRAAVSQATAAPRTAWRLWTAVAMAVAISAAGLLAAPRGLRPASGGGARATPDTAAVVAALQKGETALREAKYDDALRSFQAAQRMDPGSPEALLGVARAQDALGNTAAAYDAYDAAAKAAPGVSAYPYAAGRSRLDRGDAHGAIPFLDRAIALAPNVAEYLGARAVALANDERLEEAISGYTDAINLEPANSGFYFLRGILWERRLETVKAVADFRTVAAITQDANTLRAAQARLVGLKATPVGASPGDGPRRPRVFLQYQGADDARALKQVRARLRRELTDVDVPAAELISGATSGDVRFFFKEDEALALRAKDATEAALAADGTRLRLRLMPLDGSRFARARRGAVEVWLPSLDAPQVLKGGRGTDYSPTILWVDDQPDNNAMLRLALENAGAIVVLAKGTAEALGKVGGRGRVDLVISDMGRPEGPRAGYDLLAQLRKLPAPPPLVFYAADGGTPEHRAEASAAGAIASTGTPAELLDAIRVQLPGLPR